VIVVALNAVGGAAELAAPFESALEDEREAVGATDAHVERLAVVEGIAHVVLVGVHIGLLEMSVGQEAVAKVAFHAEPTIGEIDIFGDFDANLRDGARVDAEGLRAAGEFLIFLLHRPLFAAYAEAEPTVVEVGVSLLNV